jgi:anti-sigma B factor antagonist
MDFSGVPGVPKGGRMKQRRPALQNPQRSRSVNGAEGDRPESAPRSQGGPLDISVRRRTQVQLIQLRGQLRLGPPVDELRQTVEEAIANGDIRFVINLADVPMIDSSGIGLLVRFLASTKQRGGSLKLTQPSKFAVQTLRLVGVLNLFEVFDDDDKAVKSFA